MATPATLELQQCPVCGAGHAHPFSVGGVELHACGGCGAVYSPRYADPSAVYADGYYTGDSPFGIDTRHPRFQAFLADVNAQRAALLASVTGDGLKALDVGCGTGDFMAALRDRGWTVAGADPIEESGGEARARGLDVRTALLDASGLPPGGWDVVSALHVLEHMPDCAGFLRTLARWARPGGWVLVESPNWASHLRRASGDRYVHLRPLEHLVHLTPDTLRVAFERAGLEPVAVRTPTWPSRLHTPTEALADTGRGSWATLPAARALARAARTWDGWRGRGMVVWGLARVPGR
jgi:SAM-dependent methyltransferase